MKLIWILSLVVIAVAYDDVDDDYYGKILSEKSALENFYKCLIDRAPCDDFGNHVKTHMVEFFSDACKECDARQKHFSHLHMMIVENDYPKLLNALQNKYDLTSNIKNVDKKLKQYYAVTMHNSCN